MINLRKYQRECINAIIDNAKSGVFRQVAVLATGSGKTIIFSHLMPLVKAKGKKTLVLCHREELLYQAKDKIEKIAPTLKVSIEQANKNCGISDDVIIASVPTLGRKDSKRIQKFNPEEFGLIVQDECHHSTSESFKRIYEYFDVLKNKIKKNNNRVLIGFTATPSRADHIGLDTIFDKITYNYPLRQAIDEGYLANIKAFSVTTKADISKVKSRMGDFSDKDLEEVVNTEERNKLIIETYQELANNTKALVFAVDVQHTKDLCEYFNKAGILAKYVVGETDKTERKNTIKEFKEGKIKVLIGCGVFTEGYDEPSIETILMARPTKSSVLYSQMAGRGTRLTDTKKHLNLIDFVDNIGSNHIITLPSLFGCSKTLKGTKGKYITEIADLVNEMNEVNPDYDYSEVDDWNNEEKIEKVIKEINIFAQAEIPEEVKNNSQYSWEKVREGFIIKFPPNSNNKKFVLELKPNMLNQYELKIKEYIRVTPNRLNGYSGWQKESENIHSKTDNIEDAFKEGDALIASSFSEYSTMFNRKSKWRDAKPTEKQLNLLRKFNVPIPAGITKGQCATIIGKKFNEIKK